MTLFPLVHEIAFQDPFDVYARLPAESTLLLESAMLTKQSRYSFIAFSPFQFWSSQQEGAPLAPWELLEEGLTRYAQPPLPHLPPFQGGYAGIWGYELHSSLEAVPWARTDDLSFPVWMIGAYDLVIAFDHVLRRAWIFSNGLPETGPQRKERASERLAFALSLLRRTPSIFKEEWSLASSSITSSFDQAGYEESVRKGIAYIRAGDIFEVNLSQRFSCHLPEDIDVRTLYHRLRRVNPAPFSACFQYGDYGIASASPERFLRLQEGRVEARPIKGTCLRALSPEDDAKRAHALWQSEKDRAENIMIVDLMRNDLSRVSKPHSVQVPQLCGLESFETVHHLVSCVEGELETGKTAIDLLKATFPGGSITGAPKIRAMEIIAEIEPVVRGPYCGSIGYIGFDGQMDLSIVIRTFVMRGRFLTFHAGGAVTVESDPTAEYRETLAKAKALRHTVTGECLGEGLRERA